MGQTIRVHVDNWGKPSIQLALGQRPLSEAQMKKVNRLLSTKESDYTYGRQFLIDLSTDEVRRVSRKDEL